MSPPQDGTTTFDGFALSNGTFVVIELQTVNRGSLAILEEQARSTLISSNVEADGRASFDAFLANSRSNAEIVQNLEIMEPLL